MVRIEKRYFAFIWTSTNLKWLAPDRPVGIGVVVAVVDVSAGEACLARLKSSALMALLEHHLQRLPQIVDIVVEVPVSCDIVEAVVL